MTKHLPSALGGIVSGLSVFLASALYGDFWVQCVAAGCGGFAGTYLAQKLGG